MIKVLITGADGFLGKNLQQHLANRDDVHVVCFTRANRLHELPHLLDGVEFVFHLAGVNRPSDPADFVTGNTDLTVALVEAIEYEMRKNESTLSILFSSSTQAALDNPYGTSKRAAEGVLRAFAMRNQAPVHLCRLPNVFGKWCRPYYNSAVATFCHNISRGLPVQVINPFAPINLVYIDDVVDIFIQLMDGSDVMVDSEGFVSFTPQYSTTVGEVLRHIESFHASRDTLVIDRVGSGLVRALYSTYVSYLPPGSFSYPVPMHGDARGVFVEMLKTPDCGQFSFFTAHPGITRGVHFHHTKTEKFLVIKGDARFRFRHIQTGELHELVTSARRAEIVESIPGWSHDITNIGHQEMIVMLWANEIFDRSNPDTYACPL